VVYVHALLASLRHPCRHATQGVYPLIIQNELPNSWVQPSDDQWCLVRKAAISTEKTGSGSAVWCQLQDVSEYVAVRPVEFVGSYARQSHAASDAPTYSLRSLKTSDEILRMCGPETSVPSSAAPVHRFQANGANTKTFTQVFHDLGLVSHGGRGDRHTCGQIRALVNQYSGRTLYHLGRATSQPGPLRILYLRRTVARQTDGLHVLGEPAGLLLGHHAVGGDVTARVDAMLAGGAPDAGRHPL
jgi:hypothetical protein